MTLDQIKRGQSCRIVNIMDQKIREQAIRFGISEGEKVICEEVIKSGPIILRKNHQQIALGRRVACNIMVE